MSQIHVPVCGLVRIMRGMSKKKPAKNDNVIARNKRATFDYHLLCLLYTSDAADE